MINNLPRFGTVLLAILWAGNSQATTTYICQVEGKAAFSTIKVNSSCKESSMDGISTDVASEKQAELKPEDNESKESHTINQKKNQDILSSYDDVVIMPKAAEMVTNSALAARTSRAGNAQMTPPKLEIKLRKQSKISPSVAAINNKRQSASIKTAAPIRTAAPAVVLLPPPSKPQFTRKQILQREISNEHAALIRTKAQLEMVRKKGGNTTPLLQAVRDREANIRAIQGEMNKI